VLVEYTDLQDSEFGSCYTVKEYQSKKSVSEDGWEHESIILKPLSTHSDYQDLVIGEDQIALFRVIGTFECVLT
jgi:hypothetical protein